MPCSMQRDEIALQAHQDDLGFRIAHAAIELEHLDAAIRRDHQSGIEKAGVTFAILRHAVYRRLDDLAHDPARAGWA